MCFCFFFINMRTYLGTQCIWPLEFPRTREQFAPQSKMLFKTNIYHERTRGRPMNNIKHFIRNEYENIINKNRMQFR